MPKILLTNGLIYDGSGEEPFEGDILIEDETIKKIFRKEEESETWGNGIKNEAVIIDAKNRAVTPGFVDIHRHCDVLPFYGTEFGKAMIAQGITTAVTGNCGFSMVPVPEKDELAEEMFVFAEPVVGAPYRGILTYEEYSKKLDEIRLPVNLASMIGCGTIKIAVKGFSNAPFTEEEMQRASGYIDNALANGAVGVSAGIMYLPECYNSIEDYIRMLSPMKKYKVPFCVHIRGEGDRMVESIKEVIEIGEKIECPVEISHFKSCGKKNWGREIHHAISLIEKARVKGIDISCDFYPYEGGSTSLTTMIPPDFVNGDMKYAIERLGTGKGVEEFCRALQKTYSDWDNYAITLGWNRILISGVNKKGNRKFIGKSVLEAAKETGFLTPAAFAAWLIHDENGKVAIINKSMCQDDIDVVAKLPYACVISDSIYAVTDTPHPRMYGAFPKIIREYVRERHIYTLQEAIKKMTSLPAKRMNLARRGLIKEGYFADINIFDPHDFRDNATYERPMQIASGLLKCFINGKLAWEKGEMCNDGCGRKLQRTDV